MPTAASRLKLRPGETNALNKDGLRAFALRTQDEVADILGVTRQNVQQIERRALYKIRARMDYWKLQFRHQTEL
jgi:transcriptional regulator